MRGTSGQWHSQWPELGQAAEQVLSGLGKNKRGAAGGAGGGGSSSAAARRVRQRANKLRARSTKEQAALDDQLIEASNKGRTQALLATGAVAEAKDNHGDIALIIASDKGRTETAQALLAVGADKDAKNNNGDTALILASSYGPAETVQALLAAGADKDAKDNYGYTALMWAS